MDFSAFYFRYSADISDIEILAPLINFSKAWEPKEGIAPGSVGVRISRGKLGDVTLATLRKNVTVESAVQMMVMNLIMSGTKPFDALLFLRVLMNEADDETDKIFKITEINEFDRSLMYQSFAVVTACFLILITRGSFPASTQLAASNPLPKFVIGMLKDVNDEHSLRERAMSFDPKHINLSNIFSEDNLKGWPSVIANRMNMGVAGHKTLKLALLIGESGTAGTDKDKQFFVLIRRLAAQLDGGFYPALHPALNSSNNKFPRFYLNTLVVCYRVINGNHAKKVKMIKSSGGFGNERKLENEEYMSTATMDYMSWDFDALEKWLGKPQKFMEYEKVTSQEKKQAKNLIAQFNIKGAKLKSHEPSVATRSEGLNSSIIEAKKVDQKAKSSKIQTSLTFASPESTSSKDQVEEDDETSF